MDYGHQKYYLEQIKKHKKSILIWCRQSGKSKVIVDYLVDYVSENKNKKILVVNPKKDLSKSIHEKLWKELNLRINQIGNLTLSKQEEKSVVNTNEVYFKHRNYEFYIRMSDLVIVENFEYIKDLHLFLNHFNKDTAFILTSSQFQTESLTYIDKEGDCYLGILSYSSIANDKQINERIMLFGDKGVYNIQNEYGNIDELYSELGVKKDRSLIDVWGLKIQRRRKLDEISKKINENDDD